MQSISEANFAFSFNTRIRFGPGARQQLPAVLRAEGWRNVGVLVDHGLRDVVLVTDLLSELADSTDELTVGWCSVSEPTYDALEEARREFEDPGLEAIVGIGGGSALDMAKAMAVLVHNREAAVRYRGFDRMTEPVLPIVAVPTTAGTGSEITPNASFVDSKEQRKMGINGEAVRPRYGLLDPELTLSCPPGATLSAGIDSLVHATEAYVAKKTNPLARLCAREGFGRVFRALHRVMTQPDDLEARTEVMYGAFLAGIALMNSGTGPAAALSYPLGVRFGVPHGIGGGFFLPAVARHNVERGVNAYAELWRVLESEEDGGSADEQARRFIACLESEWTRLGMPRTLESLGVDAADHERVIEDTLELKAALEQNPVPFGEQELAGVLTRLSEISKA